jgi:preprotein translocase subunit YajC
LFEILTHTQLLLGASGTGATGLDAVIQFVPLIVIFGIFYFLLIRPQQKKQQQLQAMLKNVKRGDRIITTGGMYGTIEGLTDTTIQLKIAAQVKITLSRSAIAGLQPSTETTTEE